MNYIEIHLTDHCNLKCVGCSHFSNISKPYFKPLEDFITEMQDLRDKTEVRTIRLMGGEPLLHPNWLRFCEVTREIFPHAHIVLVTNGVLLNKILPDEVNELNALDITVCMSDYELNLNKPAVFGIHKTEIHGKGELYNISLDLKGIQDKEVSFKNCDLHTHGWNFYKDGKLYPCCVMGNIEIFLEHFGLELNNDRGISVKDHTIDEINEFLNTPTEACRYCNTIARSHSKVSWCKSKGDISEWTIKEGKQ